MGEQGESWEGLGFEWGLRDVHDFMFNVGRRTW